MFSFESNCLCNRIPFCSPFPISLYSVATSRRRRILLAILRLTFVKRELQEILLIANTLLFIPYTLNRIRRCTSQNGITNR